MDGPWQKGTPASRVRQMQQSFQGFLKLLDFMEFRGSARFLAGAKNPVDRGTRA